jgi:hypothetical protein
MFLKSCIIMAKSSAQSAAPSSLSQHTVSSEQCAVLVSQGTRRNKDHLGAVAWAIPFFA